MKDIVKIFSILMFLCLNASGAFAESIRVGVVLPLTGGLAEYGSAAKNGITLALEEHPELFRNLEFLYEDDRYEAKLALSAYQKLVMVDKVDLMYLWGIAPAGAVAPVAEAQKFPIFAVTCQRDIGKGRSYVVRFCYQGQEGGKILLEYLRSKGYKRLGLVTTELAFINTVVEGMRENLKSDESLEVVDSFLFEDTDFRGTIAKLKKKHFDAIGVFLGSGQISQFYRQATSLKLEAKTFGTDFFDSLSQAREAGDAMSGAVFAAPATNREFVSRYRRRFGNDLQIPWAANAYDFAILLGRYVVTEGKRPSGTEIIDAITKVRSFKGASNSIEFHKDEEIGAGFDFPVTVKMIDKEEIVEIPFASGR